jgi:hypothetical protein
MKSDHEALVDQLLKFRSTEIEKEQEGEEGKDEKEEKEEEGKFSPFAFLLNQFKLWRSTVPEGTSGERRGEEEEEGEEERGDVADPTYTLDALRNSYLDRSNNYGILIAKYIIENIENSNPFLELYYPTAVSALRSAYYATMKNYKEKIHTPMSDFPTGYNKWTTWIAKVGKVGKVDTPNEREQTFEKLNIIRSPLLTLLLQEVFSTFKKERYTGDVKQLIEKKTRLYEERVLSEIVKYMQNKNSRYTPLDQRELQKASACSDKFDLFRIAVAQCETLNNGHEQHANEKPCLTMGPLEEELNRCIEPDPPG